MNVCDCMCVVVVAVICWFVYHESLSPFPHVPSSKLPQQPPFLTHPLSHTLNIPHFSHTLTHTPSTPPPPFTHTLSHTHPQHPSPPLTHTLYHPLSPPLTHTLYHPLSPPHRNSTNQMHTRQLHNVPDSPGHLSNWLPWLFYSHGVTAQHVSWMSLLGMCYPKQS